MNQRMVMLDVNVLLDCYLGFREGCDIARKFIDCANRKGVELLTTPACVSTWFFMFQVEMKRRALQEKGDLTEADALAIKSSAWSCLEHLLDNMTIAGCGHVDARMALKHRALHDDFEDNLTLAMAQCAHVDLLVTNDAELIAHAPVPALDVRDAVAYLEAS